MDGQLSRQVAGQESAEEADARRGFLLGLAAYTLWGVFPVYWTLLEPAGAVELLAHRVLWSAVFMVALLAVLRRSSALGTLVRSRRSLWLLVGAAVVISVNWGTFIWGVNNGHVVETSLGYFMNPLVLVLVGVLVLGEQLRRWQWVAVGLAAVAVTGLTLDHGRPPWVALTLAASFAAYGLLRKQAGVGAVEGLTLETLLIAPFALAYLVWLTEVGRSQALVDFPQHLLLLATTGVVTALPLMCFGAAATRVRLTTLGLLQYVAPSFQFLLGITVFGEPMPAARWAGFALIWIALALSTWDTLRERRRVRLQLEATPA